MPLLRSSGAPLKIITIKKSAEFQKISKKNEKFYSKTILLLTSSTPSLYFLDKKTGKNAQDFCRVGYTVSKLIGNAVARNLAKRRLREAFRALVSLTKNHHDYVVIARKEIAEADYEKILADLKFCLKRIGKENPKTNS